MITRLPLSLFKRETLKRDRHAEKDIIMLVRCVAASTQLLLVLQQLIYSQ